MPLIQENECDEDLHRLRDSLSRVLARAVENLFPGTRLGSGLAVDDGFYFDFLFADGVAVSPDDFPRIEKEMRALLPEALLPEALPSAGLPPAFKLHNIAGAYWQGDEKNVMMTRLYGYAYHSKDELDVRVARVKQARERDHRKLGRQLGIFAFSDDVGPGLPLWLPNGTVIRDELEKLAREIEFKAGYKRVATPHIAKEELFLTSGHLPLYKDGMFPPMQMEDEAYYMKPMNCPFHHEVFAAEPRSYRDLPLRLTEYGPVYRFERSGQLQGLARVRGMTMNDAHIYVTEEQLKDELKAVMELHRQYYELFDFDDYFLRLSLWDPDDPKRKNKYFDNPEAWDKTQGLVREVLDELGLDYKMSKGEAAFYGPKVDFQFRSVIEKEYTVSTNQLDFAQPSRFGLKYIDRDGREKTPYCIHRAPLSTHERFVAFLLEHYGGAFPTWLAPVQVGIVPISERHFEYADRVEAALRERFIRAEVDRGDKAMGKKIRDGVTRKIPLLAIVGDQEVESDSVTVRRYGIRRQEMLGVDALADLLEEEIRQRRHVRA